jgi:hypothetical protein
VLFARGDAHQPMTVAEVVVRKAALLGAEQKGDPARFELPVDEPRAIFQPSQRVRQFPVTDRCGSNHQRAVGHGFGNALVLFRARQQRRSSDGGTRLAKGYVVRVHHSKPEKPEIADGASGRADVERIARGHQHNAQTVEFSRNRQGWLFYDAHAATRIAGFSTPGVGSLRVARSGRKVNQEISLANVGDCLLLGTAKTHSQQVRILISAVACTTLGTVLGMRGVAGRGTTWLHTVGPCVGATATGAAGPRGTAVAALRARVGC